jgi:acetyl-CoA carboxylase biotin carboxylase subunit
MGIPTRSVLPEEEYPSVFKRVLIANRGEIAVRVLRACRELGIQTVAVYSDVERSVLHVRNADEAFYLGPAPPRDSYLRIDRLIEIAHRSGADAIHPGYGFLSENSQFATACEEADIVFIGPPAKAIAAMGDKVTARLLMREAGVPVIPGTEVDLHDDEIVQQAERVGYPLFIKAAAGGGGKGMRLVHKAEELSHALGAARREAQGAFGDSRVYLEKAIQGAHHVEVQVLADSHGNVIHLGERECSIQRRHQKLIEESPSPTIDQDTRDRMGQIAVRAADAAGYVNAGTVEFLLGADGDFYFLEMNTRLQVEHAITEIVTGVDIVKEQLKIAFGARLPYSQDDIRMTGWAIECRITAEDPFRGFLPTTGRIISLSEPSGPGIRVDSGIFEGFEVTHHYDPLLAKLVAYGSGREEAILCMRRALHEYRIGGISTSLPFHRMAVETDSFVEGQYDTSFVDQLLPPSSAEQEELRLAAAVTAVMLHHQESRRSASGPSRSSDQPDSMWRLVGRREATGR